MSGLNAIVYVAGLALLALGAWAGYVVGHWFGRQEK